MGKGGIMHTDIKKLSKRNINDLRQVARNPFIAAAGSAKDRATTERIRFGLEPIPFDIDSNYIASIFNGKCAVADCQRQLIWNLPTFDKNGNIVSGREQPQVYPERPELDKKVEELGYVRGNVYWLCNECNRLKNALTKQKMKALLVYMEDETPPETKDNYEEVIVNGISLKERAEVIPRPEIYNKGKSGMLTKEQILEIKSSTISNKELAQKYGCSPSYIYTIKVGKRLASVTES